MEKYLVFIVLVVVGVSGHRPHHPKFPHKDFKDDDGPNYTQVECSRSHRSLRDKIIEESRCGVPKDVFITLYPKSTHEEISPRAVWVKRCVGLCEFDNSGSCVATAVAKKEIAVRVYNAQTEKERCATYTVEEHVSCGCCVGKQADCAAPKIFVPRKCSCQCPNSEDRRQCLRKKTTRWNRSKCICEKRKRMRI